MCAACVAATSQIKVIFWGGRSESLDVIEYQPVDRAAYQWEAGWLAASTDGQREYFISESGRVDYAYLDVDEDGDPRVTAWRMGMAMAPEIKEEADAREALYDSWYWESESRQDEGF